MPYIFTRIARAWQTARSEFSEFVAPYPMILLSCHNQRIAAYEKLLTEAENAAWNSADRAHELQKRLDAALAHIRSLESTPKSPTPKKPRVKKNPRVLKFSRRSSKKAA